MGTEAGLELPASFGKYELLERIATGGMAEVFLARAFGVAGFEKHLVIKRIRPEFAQDPRFISMFINEAKISVNLSHPNVVQVYDLGRVGQSWYIAMEHLHGRDLTRLVKTLRARGDSLPLPVCVGITAEVCRGLAYAHGLADASGEVLGLVHRDVSPHNLFVTFAGEVKLVDFGIARLMNTAVARAEGMAPGRPGGGKYAYMSPEQSLGAPVDHRTDLFSTGIVLWELLCNHRLFDHPDPAEKLRLVQQVVVPDPRDEGVDIDDELWRILCKALARDPDDRYPTAALLEEDLRAWLHSRGHRVGSTEIARAMADAFPEDAANPPGTLDIARMVEDMEQLDADTGDPPMHTPTPTSESLPGRLRPAPSERKTVTALVVDVDGLTELSARVDPEVLFRRHYQLLRWVRRAADRYGGVVQRAVDDQVLLLFGIPRTRADDAERALSCALELMRTTEELHARGLQVSLAMGAHTGEITMGPQINELRKRRMVARGDTTRLARRLSALADHGQILVSQRVLQAVEGRFRIHRGPGVPNRGGRPPTPSFQVQARRTGPRTARQGQWLRRGAELEVFRDALMGLSRGEGSAILLHGATGTGKSRLVGELQQLSRRRGLPMYVTRCAAWGEEIPLEHLRDLARQVAFLQGDSTEEEIRERVAALSQLGLNSHHLAAVVELMGDSPPEADPAWMAMQRALQGLVEAGPVILAFEDAHHLRPAELRRLARLVRNLASRPVLFILSWRGPVPPALAGGTMPVELGAFSADSQRRLLRSLLEAERVADGLATFVERTCEGNPLYIEEMAKYLVHRGYAEVGEDGVARLRGEVDLSEVPYGLAGVIAARIDALDPASKGILQLASLVGTTFSARLLADASGVDDATPLVSDLASNGLIRRIESAGGDQWAFATELVREVAARGILGVQRRDYHRLIAAGIEAWAGDSVDAHAESLAHHCAHGGRLVDAARYGYVAGQALERGRFLERARETYARALSWISQVEQTPDTWDARVQGEAMLHLRIGVVSMLLGQADVGEHALQLALDIASDAGLPWIEIRAHTELGLSYLHSSRLSMAQAHVAQAQALMRLERDPELELEVLEASATVAQESGRTAEAEELWQRALAGAQDPGARARCLLGLATLHIRAGHHQEPTRLLEEALDEAREAKDRILEGRVLNNIGLVHVSAGQHDEALWCFRRALAVREGIGYPRGLAVNHHNIGDVHFARQDWARAHVAFTRSRDLSRSMGWERGVLMNELYLGFIDAQEGRVDEGLARVRAATQEGRTLGDLELSATGAWLLGRWFARANQPEQAREHLEQGLSEARTQDLPAMVDKLEAVLATLQG